MTTPQAIDWKITVTMGMGWDARVEVFNPAGSIIARCAWLPSPAAAFGWGLQQLEQVTAGRPAQVAAPGAGEAAGPGRAGFDSQAGAPPDPWAPPNYRFRKLPVVIEAFQLTAETRQDNRDWPEWLNRAWQLESWQSGAVGPWRDGAEDGPLAIETLEGRHRADMGDWIIRGVRGELYPCQPEIFAATYEPAPSSPEGT